MNVGIVTAWLERGSTYVSKALAASLCESGEVHVFVRGGEKYDLGIVSPAVKSVTAAQRLSVASSVYVSQAELWDWVRSHHIDALIFNEQTDWRIISAIQGWPILLGAYVDSYNHRTVPFFALFDFLICNTRRHFSVFRAHPQAWLIPWGTDTALFSPQLRHVSGSGPVRFFHSCGFSPRRKGTDLICGALAKTAADFHLTIHTIAPLDSLGALESDSRVDVVRGEVPAPGLYERGDVYLYPTRSEGIGLTIAEALASGLAVVGTNVAPVNEFVRHGSNGLLLRSVRESTTDYYWPDSEVDVNELAEVMDCLSADPSMVKRLCDEARRDACERLDWTKNAAELPRLIAGATRLRSRRSVLRAEVFAYSHLQAGASRMARHIGSDRLVGRVSRKIVRRMIVGR